MISPKEYYENYTTLYKFILDLSERIKELENRSKESGKDYKPKECNIIPMKIINKKQIKGSTQTPLLTIRTNLAILPLLRKT